MTMAAQRSKMHGPMSNLRLLQLAEQHDFLPQYYVAEYAVDAEQAGIDYM